MANEEVIGTCGICSGPVMRVGAWYSTGPVPPPKCAVCGATVKNPYGYRLDMEPPKKDEPKP